MTKKKLALLVMSFGTARSLDGIEDYYTRIRQGRKPSAELLEELTGRFKQIGLSPLNEITQAQGEELVRQLNGAQEEIEFKLYVGFQYVAPFIGDVVRELYADGFRELVAVAMAPHYSRFSVETYHDRVWEAAADLPGLTITAVKQWWKEPEFAEFWAENIKRELVTIPVAEQERAVVILSAHSLPEKLMAIEDTYKRQVSESADQIIKAAAGPEHYAKAWQSEGKDASSENKWLGPDVQDLTRELYAAKGYRHFIYCPIGFVAEHLEVFYDNDYECRVVCDELGVIYHRPPMPNADPLFMQAVTNAVLKQR